VGDETVKVLLGTSNPDSLEGPSTIANVKGGNVLEVVDWNNDGKKDLLVMDVRRCVLRLYLNQGTDAAPSFNARADTVTGTDFGRCDETHEPWLTDWNGDGKIDLLLGGDYDISCSSPRARVKVYLNISDTDEPEFKYGEYLTMDNKVIRGDDIQWIYQAFPAFALCDINNDNYTDMYLGCWLPWSIPNDLFLYLGDATTQATFDFASETKCTFGTNNRYVTYIIPFVIDYNNDGLDDLVIANNKDYGAGYAGDINLHLNTGTATAPQFSHGHGHSAPVLQYQPRHCHLPDLVPGRRLGRAPHARR
jgi:hypothetical protein